MAAGGGRGREPSRVSRWEGKGKGREAEQRSQQRAAGPGAGTAWPLLRRHPAGQGRNSSISAIREQAAEARGMVSLCPSKSQPLRQQRKRS